MPIQPTYPGVYIQEISSGVRTITGVATSIAAFLGRASKGKMNQATRILSLADFIRKFGDPLPGVDLAHSVRLFFENGGSECYVVRLANGAKAAGLTIKALDGQPVLDVGAKAEGRWGDTVRLEVDYNTAYPDETFNLRVIHEEGGAVAATESFLNLSMDPNSARYAPKFVTQSSELIELKENAALTPRLNDLTQSFAGFSQARRPLGATIADVDTFLSTQIGAAASLTTRAQFEISVNNSPFETVKLRPYNIASVTGANIENFIAGRIIDALSGVSPAPTVTCELSGPIGNIGRLLRIIAANGDQSSVKVRRAPSDDISEVLMLGVDQGGIEAVRRSNFRPAPTATFLRLSDAVNQDPQTHINNLADFLQNTLQSITIDGAAASFAGDYSLQTTTNPTDPWIMSKPIAGSVNGDNDGVREKLKIIAAAITNAPNMPYKAEVWGYHLAIIPRSGPFNLLPTISLTPTNATTDKLLIPLADTRNGRQYTLGAAGSGQFSTAGAPGLDGDAPTVEDYKGNPANQTGLYALESVDLFNLMVIPADEGVIEAEHLQLWGPASNYCEKRRAFLLIDPPKSWTTLSGRPKVVEDTSKIDSDIRTKVIKKNSAVFYPQLKFGDRGLIKSIGPSGAIAGLMARIDSNRGVWKAPAGTEAELRGLLGLEVKLVDGENGVLNKLGVNSIRSFPNGFVSWGARTLEGSDDFGSEWKYIPIRRLALFLEESLFRGTKWIVFEPNDEPLWAKIRLNLTAFMLGLFRQGAFQGSTPDQAFFVKCDAETTTQNDRNLGIVNIQVGFAPLKPAEFVIISIQQMAGEL